MDIDWETPARLDCFMILNDPRPMPPPVDGPLRACLEAVQKWPIATVPTLHTDRPVNGRTVFNRDQIGELIQLLRES